MEITSLKVEDRLDGASNFLSWKVRVTLAFKEYDIWELVDKVVPPPIDPTTLESHNKKEIKAQRVILDSVKDHLIPHLSEKKMTKELFDALVGLFQSTNMNRKMVLRNKLRSVQMSRFDNVTSYFMRIRQVRDQLVAIGEKTEDTELVNVELNGLPKSWNHLSREFALGNISQIGRDFGMIASRKRLTRSLRETSREVVKRTFFL
jgi:hypothetical protein